MGTASPFLINIYILDMPNKNNDIQNLDLDQLIGNMSSINSEDYWFTKVSKIEEYDESAPQKPDSESHQR
ncbi:hypothetical protein FSU_0795 [Fibrobacter succinogenes subsp. succinogenes S85]|uniref:Uncharacterized protein n=2 Tax=Fibrobacter succinogenes (strain ATCC 19169 / S85) TaxID=59374 RepID=D9S829_FIBSS|nr:hypothetical protein FSU_0795 [Fibrobacter succinogenes subsp. succinogenes S85]